MQRLQWALQASGDSYMSLQQPNLPTSASAQLREGAREKDRKEVKGLSERGEKERRKAEESRGGQWSGNLRPAMERERRADRGGKSKSVSQASMLIALVQSYRQTCCMEETGGRTPRDAGETYNRTEECEKREDPPLGLPS